MKKAIFFFTTAIIINLVCLILFSLLFNKTAYNASGVIAIITGLISLLFPLQTLKFIGSFPQLPFYILLFGIKLVFGLLTITICSLEIFSPFYFVLFLINEPKLQVGVGKYMIIIIFLTAWIALRKQYKNLISKSWKIGFKLIDDLIKPFESPIKEIDDFINKVYKFLEE